MHFLFFSFFTSGLLGAMLLRTLHFFSLKGGSSFVVCRPKEVFYFHSFWVQQFHVLFKIFPVVNSIITENLHGKKELCDTTLEIQHLPENCSASMTLCKSKIFLTSHVLMRHPLSRLILPLLSFQIPTLWAYYPISYMFDKVGLGLSK